MFKKILAAIGNFFSKEAPIVEDAFTKGSGLINVIKTFEGSVTGQTLEALVDLVLPGIGPAVFTALNAFFTDFGIVGTAVTGIASDVSATGLNAVAKLSGDSRTLALHNVAAIISNVSSNANGGNSTLQQALVSMPIVHNPNVLDTPASPNGPSTGPATS